MPYIHHGVELCTRCLYDKPAEVLLPVIPKLSDLLSNDTVFRIILCNDLGSFRTVLLTKKEYNLLRLSRRKRNNGGKTAAGILIVIHLT